MSKLYRVNVNGANETCVYLVIEHLSDERMFFNIYPLLGAENHFKRITYSNTIHSSINSFLERHLVGTDWHIISNEQIDDPMTKRVEYIQNQKIPIDVAKDWYFANDELINRYTEEERCDRYKLENDLIKNGMLTFGQAGIELGLVKESASQLFTLLSNEFNLKPVVNNSFELVSKELIKYIKSKYTDKSAVFKNRTSKLLSLQEKITQDLNIPLTPQYCVIDRHIGVQEEKRHLAICNDYILGRPISRKYVVEILNPQKPNHLGLDTISVFSYALFKGNLNEKVIIPENTDKKMKRVMEAISE